MTTADLELPGAAPRPYLPWLQRAIRASGVSPWLAGLAVAALQLASLFAVFGLGGSSSALAQETQYRLFRYGVVVSAHSDPYVMRMTASTLKPNDVVIAISATGNTREVVEAGLVA